MKNARTPPNARVDLSIHGGRGVVVHLRHLIDAGHPATVLDGRGSREWSFREMPDRIVRSRDLAFAHLDGREDLDITSGASMH